ncbi:MAG: CsgG/HfaB family protein [candidate division KSB1 bacterium]|nr:CsgG/HfaB family protein [candidate division KSB1 bacterium]
MRASAIRRILMVFFALAWSVLQAPGQETSVTVAVLEFHNASGVKSWDALGSVVSEMLKTELSRSPHLQVLERTALEGVLRELALQQSGVLQEQEAVVVGEMAGARYVIQGTISRTARGQRLDAHIVEVSTGRVLGEKVEGDASGALPHMVQLLAHNIIYDLTGNGGHLRQARLRNYPAQFAIGSTLLFGLAAVVTHLNYRDARAEYMEATHLAEFDRAYERANGNLKARNVLLGMTGVSALVSLSLVAANSAESNYLVASAEPLSEAKVALQTRWEGDGVRLALTLRW